MFHSLSGISSSPPHPLSRGYIPYLLFNLRANQFRQPDYLPRRDLYAHKRAFSEVLRQECCKKFHIWSLWMSTFICELLCFVNFLSEVCFIRLSSLFQIEMFYLFEMLFWDPKSYKRQSMTLMKSKSAFPET